MRGRKQKKNGELVKGIRWRKYFTIYKIEISEKALGHQRVEMLSML